MRGEPSNPSKVRAYCGTCTRDERNERYATAKVLREALDEFFHESEFLFNHSTLAVYLKGLLRRVRGILPYMSPQKTRPVMWS